MAGSLGVLSVDLIAKTGGFNKNLRDAERRTESFGRKMRQFSRNVKRHFGTAIKLTKRLSLSVVALGGSFAVLATKMSGTAEHLSDVANQAGTTADQIQILNRAAYVAGTPIDALNNSLARYTKRVGKAAQDTGPSIDALKDL